jgi:nucleotide-binding universal stress UspA family protein
VFWFELPPVIAVAPAKSFWPIELANDGTDKAVTTVPIKPNRSAMRIVRVESKRREEVGRFRGNMSSKSPGWKMNTYPGRRDAAAKRRHFNQGTWARISLLTKPWNEECPHVAPIPSRETMNNSASAVSCDALVEQATGHSRRRRL